MSDPRKAKQQPAPPPALRGYAIGVVAGLVLAALVGLVVVGPLVLTHRTDLPLERAYGRFAVSLVSRLGAGNQQNPLAGNQRAIEAGRAAYTGSCSQCHGATGDGKGVFGLATYPQATALAQEDTQEKSDARLFWIVKNGLSFTGMPAYGDAYSEQDLWSIVSYLRTLKSGQSVLEVPAPTPEQLAAADPKGGAPQRGAAVYFAQKCDSCHGAIGNAPGELAIGERGEMTEAIRRGRRGMPVYSPDLLTDAQLADLQAYVGTFPSRPRGGRSG